MTLPGWIRIRYADNPNTRVVGQFASEIATVCQSAHCPNRSECWSKGTATFMIMGDECTRGCRFCAIKVRPKPKALDPKEPERLANAIKTLNLNYAVITSVARDDLPDGGAEHFASCIREIRKSSPKTKLEVLIPDFRANSDSIRLIIESKPEVVSHNIETVERLSPAVRDGRAKYRQSLEVLRKYSESGMITKSGMMLGLGEIEGEVRTAMKDLYDSGVRIITIGQYLRPTLEARYLPVNEFIHPDQFKKYEEIGYEIGFGFVASGPMVRSSYKAEEGYEKLQMKEKYHSVLNTVK